MSQVTAESFLNNVKNHTLTVLLDQGVYRHIELSNSGSFDQYFEIITGPSYLFYRGDMGSFAFERLPDMFEFFRRPELKINEGYWRQKVVAENMHDGCEKFSIKVFEDYVRRAFDNFIYEKKLSEIETESFNKLFDEVLCVEFEHEAYERISEWCFSLTINGEEKDFKAKDVFGQDTWECDFKDYTVHFIWCLYAIVWGIQQYDKFKSAERQKPELKADIDFKDDATWLKLDFSGKKFCLNLNMHPNARFLANSYRKYKNATS